MTGQTADDASKLCRLQTLRSCRLRLLLSPPSSPWSHISAQACYYCLACDQLPNKLCPGHCSATNNRMWSSEATKLPKLVLVATQTTPIPSPSRRGWAPSLGSQLRKTSTPTLFMSCCFFTLSCVFWQRRAELEASEPLYQSSCICPTPQESSRRVTWFNSKIIKNTHTHNSKNTSLHLPPVFFLPSLPQTSESYQKISFLIKVDTCMWGILNLWENKLPRRRMMRKHKCIDRSWREKKFLQGGLDKTE